MYRHEIFYIQKHEVEYILRTRCMYVVSVFSHLGESPQRYDGWKLPLKAAINQFWKGLKAVLVVLLLLLLRKQIKPPDEATGKYAAEGRKSKGKEYHFLVTASYAARCW